MEAGWQFIQVMAGGQGMINAAFFLSLAADNLLMTELITGLLLALPVYGLLRRLAERLQQWSVPVFGSLPAMSTVAIGRLTLFGALLYSILISIAAQAYHPFLYFQF